MASFSDDATRHARLQATALLLLQITIAFLWLHAGWEKVTGDFAAGLPQTFERFASENPYPFYKAFLLSFALPHAGVFAALVQWSQMLIGIVLFLGTIAIAWGKAALPTAAYALCLLALLGGALMNANFWLAGGWTGPSTATANAAMFWPQLILAWTWLMHLRPVTHARTGA